MLAGSGDPAARVRVQGSCLERPALDGAAVEVQVDGIPVGAIELRAGEPVDRSWPLPEDLVGRPYLGLTFTATDYVHENPRRASCAALQLERVAIEP